MILHLHASLEARDVVGGFLQCRHAINTQLSCGIESQILKSIYLGTNEIKTGSTCIYVNDKKIPKRNEI